MWISKKKFNQMVENEVNNRMLEQEEKRRQREEHIRFFSEIDKLKETIVHIKEDVEREFDDHRRHCHHMPF